MAAAPRSYRLRYQPGENKPIFTPVETGIRKIAEVRRKKMFGRQSEEGAEGESVPLSSTQYNKTSEPGGEVRRFVARASTRSSFCLYQKAQCERRCPQESALGQKRTEARRVGRAQADVDDNFCRRLGNFVAVQELAVARVMKGTVGRTCVQVGRRPHAIGHLQQLRLLMLCR